MKKIFALFTLFFSVYFTNIEAQKGKLNELFDKYQESEGVTSIKIAKPMFSMLGNLNIDDADMDQIKPFLNSIDGLRILVLEKSDSTMSKNQLMSLDSIQNQISSAMKNLNYEELMTVNQKDAKIRFMASDVTSGFVDNMVLSIDSGGDQVLMMLDGKVSMDDVNHLVNEANVNSNKPSNKTSGTINSTNTQIRNVGNFHGINVSQGINVSFTQGNPQLVRVETEPENQQYISTEVVDGILIIGIKNNKRNTKFKKMSVDVVAPNLTDLDVNSAATFKGLNKISAENLTVNANSAGSITMDADVSQKTDLDVNSGGKLNLNLNTNRIDVDSNSAGNVTLTGKANHGIFNVSSAGQCNAENFTLKTATADASSAGSLKLNISDSLDAKASSAGQIKYKGSPTNVNTNADKMSAGQISKF